MLCKPTHSYEEVYTAKIIKISFVGLLWVSQAFKMSSRSEQIFHLSS